MIGGPSQRVGLSTLHAARAIVAERTAH